MTPDNEDLKRQPLLFRTGQHIQHQSQQSLIFFIAIYFNGSLCFALFNNAHISERFYTVVKLPAN